MQWLVLRANTNISLVRFYYKHISIMYLPEVAMLCILKHKGHSLLTFDRALIWYKKQYWHFTIKLLWKPENTFRK